MTVLPGPSGKGNVMVATRPSAVTFSVPGTPKRCVTIHRAQMHTPIYQYTRSSIRKVRVVSRWQEAVEWKACMTQGYTNSGS